MLVDAALMLMQMLRGYLLLLLPRAPSTPLMRTRMRMFPLSLEGEETELLLLPGSLTPFVSVAGKGLAPASGC